MRNPWVWVWCLAAGIIVGFILGRGWQGPDDPAQTAPPALADAPDEPAAPAASSVAAIESPTAPVTVGERPAPPVSAATSPVEPPAASPAPAKPGEESFAPPVDSGVVNSIDAGATFNKMIGRQSTADQPNQLGDLHRALEREPRDDGWAYSMEAELQNSMVNDTSMGKFKMEHVECRSTICEVRVSGNGDQADAVRNLSNALPANSFNQQLFMNVSSTVSGHERIDAIYIFRRPAQKP
ncbi:MAG TPA: hypothetical protein VM146_12545 [Steroidobacteraceae bacterium]|nr:hypothetical protein [Steroidobacteraceae bacterium]